ncbi:hypothetical protein F4693_003509 [Sphingomonas endophytica]|uniref:Uncharacterized protein n=1 Tax=Sphingomonas endophytica TaxID=869719 RepID=A0A7X0MPS1_9SPHN|nr:hypothetical protein [Sphingomonas endophytica]MBB6506506.1 hypothetical protein [Sphingomonas endophytica]
MLELSVLAAVLASQNPLPPPVVNEFPSAKVEQHLANAITCDLSGSFSVDLRWHFKNGLVDAVIRRGDKVLRAQEGRKLVAALRKATDLLYVTIGCSGSNDALFHVAYLARDGDRTASLMLPVFIRADDVELDTPEPVPLLP